MGAPSFKAACTNCAYTAQEVLRPVPCAACKSIQGVEHVSPHRFELIPCAQCGGRLRFSDELETRDYETTSYRCPRCAANSMKLELTAYVHFGWDMTLPQKPLPMIGTQIDGFIRTNSPRTGEGRIAIVNQHWQQTYADRPFDESKKGTPVSCEVTELLPDRERPSICVRVLREYPAKDY